MGKLGRRALALLFAVVVSAAACRGSDRQESGYDERECGSTQGPHTSYASVRLRGHSYPHSSAT